MGTEKFTKCFEHEHFCHFAMQVANNTASDGTARVCRLIGAIFVCIGFKHEDQMRRVMRKPDFCIRENNTMNVQLISTFVLLHR